MFLAHKHKVSDDELAVMHFLLDCCAKWTNCEVWNIGLGVFCVNILKQNVLESEKDLRWYQ